MVIIDIGNFQEYFKKAGILTRIDIITDENTAEKISITLPYNLRIEKKETVSDAPAESPAAADPRKTVDRAGDGVRALEIPRGAATASMTGTPSSCCIFS